jgi:potassium efflux system protein
VRDIGGNPISLIYMLAVLALLASRGRLEKVLLRQARHGQARDSFKPTSVAALVTIALSSAWPLLIAFVGWRLTHAQQSVLAVAIGHGLVAAGCMLWPVMFLRRASMKGGLGEAHFAWPVESMQALHSGVGRFAVILAPLVLAAAIMQAQPSRAYADSLGRLLTMLSLLVFSGAMASLLQPTGKTLGPALARHPHGWLWRTRHTWYAVACIVPVVLAIAAGMGYHYTTLHLSYRILLTLLLIVGLVFVHGMLMRWFQIARARLAARAASMASQKVEIGGAAEDQPEIQPEAQPPIDLNAVSKQTGQIMKYLLGGMLLIGMWLIWADILPALIMLKQVQLWTAVTAVTLVDLGLAIIMLVLTVAAARNIPGLLELAVLSRLHYLDMGAKHAAATLARYVIVALGLTITFQVLGLQWDHVQWLVAAMTVGLAFGLQEIFANFVSGLIILVERPIRVGDVVTVGTVSGTVSRIRIRATTIVDWDRKELIVPNKTFITDKLVNWTLSDTVLRVVIPVGIAYGSDTEKAKALLLKAAEDHELVLDDPAPSALFMSFGSSSLDFELRAFVGKIGDLLPVRHELHMAIDEAFKANGIEIAFPQQDVHLRTIAQNVPENELLKK